MDLFQVISALYASEINCGLQTFWDGGMLVWLGDDMNGRRAEETFFREQMGEAAEWLHAEALNHYPLSGYVKTFPVEA